MTYAMFFNIIDYTKPSDDSSSVPPPLNEEILFFPTKRS